MPRLSILMIKTSLVYLVAGFAAGALILSHKAVGLHAAVGILWPMHLEWVVVGWMMQFAMGVAYWILPRFGRERRRVRQAWTCFFFLNVGVAATTLQVAAGLPQPVQTAGRGLVLAATAAFIWHAMARVRAARSQEI